VSGQIRRRMKKLRPGSRKVEGSKPSRFQPVSTMTCSSFFMSQVIASLVPLLTHNNLFSHLLWNRKFGEKESAGDVRGGRQIVFGSLQLAHRLESVQSRTMEWDEDALELVRMTYDLPRVKHAGERANRAAALDDDELILDLFFPLRFDSVGPSLLARTRSSLASPERVASFSFT
jgi:hypothetical protein